MAGVSAELSDSAEVSSDEVLAVDSSVTLWSSLDGGCWCFSFSDGGYLESIVTGKTGDGRRDSVVVVVTVRVIGGSGKQVVRRVFGMSSVRDSIGDKEEQ